MKKLLSVFLLLIFVTGCGSDQTLKVKKTTNYQDQSFEEKTFRQYGLFDKEELRDERIEYGVVVGNIVWSVILFETVVTPIILIGWYLYEPVEVKPLYRVN